MVVFFYMPQQKCKIVFLGYYFLQQFGILAPLVFVLMFLNQRIYDPSKIFHNYLEMVLVFDTAELMAEISEKIQFLILVKIALALSLDDLID